MCFPLGVYLTVFLKKNANSKSIVLITCLIIFIFELLQFVFKKGVFDIDDLILNVLGAWLGYLLLQSKYIQKIMNLIFGEGFYESN